VYCCVVFVGYPCLYASFVCLGLKNGVHDTCLTKKILFFFHSKIYTFSVVFHHGGHFVREDNNVFYRGGVQTVVSGETVDD
jgi:hypothetical protein